MTNFRVYRSIRVQDIQDVNMEKLGISWAVGESEAADFSEQFGENYIVVSAIISEDQIDIPQTNAQWNSDEHASEGEVVLKEFEDITVEFEGVEYKGNTYAANDNDETRPDPEECEASEVTNYLEEAE